MHAGDQVPIEAFVNQCFQNPRVLKIISVWRVEPIKLQEVMVSYIREIGIHFVIKSQRELLMETIVYCLKKSVEIKHMVKKAESEEKERRKSRHADV